MHNFRTGLYNTLGGPKIKPLTELSFSLIKNRY